MCRKAKMCTELGTNPSQWSKCSPLPPPDWFEGQLEFLARAVRQYVSGNRPACLSTLTNNRGDEMRDWYIEHGQTSGGHRARVLKLPEPVTVLPSERDSPYIGPKLEDKVFGRDGYRCRYCGIKLVSNRVLKALIAALKTKAFRRGGPNNETQGFLCAFFPSADHVIPRSIGGKTDMSNLITSCVPCNFGKANYTIEQIGIENPFLREAIEDGWNGLTPELSGIKTAAKAGV